MAHDGFVTSVAFSPDGRLAMTGSAVKIARARLWPIPLPIPGEPERLTLQVEVQTGFELAEDGFTIRVLDAKTWQERRRRLNAMSDPKGP